MVSVARLEIIRRHIGACSRVTVTSEASVARVECVNSRRNQPMCTNTPSSAQASALTEPLRQRPQLWIKPRFTELRFGFEVTMYSEYR